MTPKIIWFYSLVDVNCCLLATCPKYNQMYVFLCFPGRPWSTRSHREEWPRWAPRLQREQGEPWSDGNAALQTSYILALTVNLTVLADVACMWSCLFSVFPGSCRFKRRRGSSWCSRNHCKSDLVELHFTSWSQFKFYNILTARTYEARGCFHGDQRSWPPH